MLLLEIPLPINVILSDPVVAMFPPKTKLALPPPTEKTDVALPTRIPAVTIHRPLLDTPSATSPDIALSAVHNDASAPLTRHRDPGVLSATPRLAPWTVKLTLPVDAAFTRRIELPTAAATE